MRIDKTTSLGIAKNIVKVVPLIFILAMFVSHIAIPDKTFSKEERRYLVQWPSMSMEKVLDGTYTSKVETYFSDQFPFRTFWVSIQGGITKALIKK